MWISPPRAWTSRPAAMYFCLLAVGTDLDFCKHTVPQYFQCFFYSSLIARCCKSIKCILKTCFRRCKQHQIVCEKQTVDPTASSSDTLTVTVYLSCKPLQYFAEGPGHMLFEIDKTCSDIFGILPRFFENLVSENLVWSATVMTKATLGILQLSTAVISRHL